MGAGKPVVEFEQPSSFEFTPENVEKAKAHIAKYPEGKQQSAVMPLLMLAQRQNGNWIPDAAMHVIADMLSMPYIRVFEVASFYTMYNLSPMGKYHVQVCTTTPCWLRGSDDIVRACKDETGAAPGEMSEDGTFAVTEVECLGACVNAPMLEVTCGEWDKYFEDLDYESTRALLKKLKQKKMPEAGSQIGRQSSEPVTGPTTLENQRKAWEKKQAG